MAHDIDANDYEILLAIVAGVAGYLGVRATVKSVRARRTGAWSQAGRADVMASRRVQPHTSQASERQS